MTTGAAARHQCMIYDGPPSRMLPSLVATIVHNLGARVRCMHLNSPSMIAGLRSGLYAVGLVSHASLFINDTISRLNPHYVLAQTPDTRRQAVVPDLDDTLAILLVAQA